MTKWEYKSVVINDVGEYKSGYHETEPYQLDNGEVVYWQDMWVHLNQLGERGWELVAVVFEVDSEALGILKRPLEEVNDE